MAMAGNNPGDGGRDDRRQPEGAAAGDCTLAAVRALTRPPLFPPFAVVGRRGAGERPDDGSEGEGESEGSRCRDDDEDLLLRDFLEAPWPLKRPLAIASDDYATRQHWSGQSRTPLCRSMFDFDFGTSSSPSSAGAVDASATATATATVRLHPYFCFGDPHSPFGFRPWEDVGKCLRHLLLHTLESHQTDKVISLSSRGLILFLATSSAFREESDLPACPVPASARPGYYLLRCHHDESRNVLAFGCHRPGGSGGESESEGRRNCDDGFETFRVFRELSMRDDDEDGDPDWRLKACNLTRNLARLLNCLKDYTVPLLWCNNPKLSLIRGGAPGDGGAGCCIQKVYEGEHVCSVFKAPVSNMIEIYRCIERANVPHTDRLVSVVESDRGEGAGGGKRIFCRFAPVGRSYLPENLGELLAALTCVCEALVALHALDIAHRDLRWANVFRALATASDDDDGDGDEGSAPPRFSDEWYLFDLEFAARGRRPALAAHTLTPDNHAPEMVDTDYTEVHDGTTHGVETDLWGLGFMVRHAHVDVPASHAADLAALRDALLRGDPRRRPTAAQCLAELRALRARPASPEKNVDVPTTSGEPSPRAVAGYWLGS